MILIKGTTMINPKLTDKSRPSMMSIGDLWQTLAKFSETRHKDHLHLNNYPIALRIMQMESLHMLIAEIEEFHEIFSKEKK